MYTVNSYGVVVIWVRRKWNVFRIVPMDGFGAFLWTMLIHSYPWFHSFCDYVSVFSVLVQGMVDIAHSTQPHQKHMSKSNSNL